MKKCSLLMVFVILCVSCNKDDDSITVAECIQPTNLTEANLTHNSVTLQWSNPNENSSFKIEYGPSGFETGTGTISTSNSPSVTLSNLQANTTYDYYLEAVCSEDNISLRTALKSFTTLPPLVVAQFKPTLSELNLYSGPLQNLEPSMYTFEYDLNTRLYTDYAHKQRLIALPQGETMTYDGDGLPIFPDNTVLAKTFYYHNNETDESLGKQIIETRVLIKTNGEWLTGNYIWNENQTDASLDENGLELPISWIDLNGTTQNINYKVPAGTDCVMCHKTYEDITPIGPKLRSMNFDVAGNNQLQTMISQGLLTGAPSTSEIAQLIDWTDTNYSTEDRVKAYFDVNCAHCHSPGTYHNVNFFEAMDLRYETPFDDTGIYDYRYSIMTRLPSSIPEYSMPYIGVSFPHQEALDLIIPYLESME
ncbi:fibronectin type III domain-containing protein [Mangrovimonas sp. TPBH4]|uniref:fibronectin type III domain-containing protein n=1 Tax=Mangrovimonas sp. TPBH4 TaxID=1645914 RepID=UPI0009E9A957|nr:fibronectin type III domain-containing protein [Mangrovimonas sp. TPBH4]